VFSWAVYWSPITTRVHSQRPSVGFRCASPAYIASPRTVFPPDSWFPGARCVYAAWHTSRNWGRRIWSTGRGPSLPALFGFWAISCAELSYHRSRGVEKLCTLASGLSEIRIKLSECLPGNLNHLTFACPQSARLMTIILNHPPPKVTPKWRNVIL